VHHGLDVAYLADLSFDRGERQMIFEMMNVSL
jgi:hypothetical protein